MVDLPTPPLPEATATMCFTPGGPDGALAPGPRGIAAAGGAAGAAPFGFSAVSVTIAPATPDSALTTSSARLRSASASCARAGSTAMEK